VRAAIATDADRIEAARLAAEGLFEGMVDPGRPGYLEHFVDSAGGITWRNLRLDPRTNAERELGHSPPPASHGTTAAAGPSFAELMPARDRPRGWRP
jgi:hypothetical protein